MDVALVMWWVVGPPDVLTVLATTPVGLPTVCPMFDLTIGRLVNCLWLPMLMLAVKTVVIVPWTAFVGSGAIVLDFRALIRMLMLVVPFVVMRRLVVTKARVTLAGYVAMVMMIGWVVLALVVVVAVVVVVVVMVLGPGLMMLLMRWMTLLGAVVECNVVRKLGWISVWVSPASSPRRLVLLLVVVVTRKIRLVGLLPVLKLVAWDRCVKVREVIDIVVEW